MNFQYDKEERDISKAVAYIDADGDLRFKARHQEPHEQASRVLFSDEGTIGMNPYNWDPGHYLNKRVFYPGDTLTITF